MVQKAKDKPQKAEPPLDVEELDSRRLDPRLEGVKGFLENFSTFAAFGLLGGAAIAGITIAALAISSGGIGAVTAGALGAKSIALGITFASSAIAGLVGGTHYAAHRMHHAERVNDMLDEAKDLIKRKQARGVGRSAERSERPERDYERESAPHRDHDRDHDRRYEPDYDAPPRRHNYDDSEHDYQPEERAARPDWHQKILDRHPPSYVSHEERLASERSEAQERPDGYRLH
jgi:hypothetical protein